MATQTTKCKVATRSGWRRGFASIAEASKYAEQIWARTGVFVAVESYLSVARTVARQTDNR